jgi:hypothetical protein
MAYVLIFFGLLLTVAGVRNTHVDQGGNPGLFTLLRGDFTGSNSFIYWLGAIAIVGGLGYIPGIQKVSNAFLALILIVLVLSNQGVFAQFQSALQTSTTPPAPTIAPAATAIPTTVTPAPTVTPNVAPAMTPPIVPAIPGVQ